MKLDDLIIEKPESTCFLRASGDSMTWAGVEDGDILVVDKEAEKGEDRICVLVKEVGLELAKTANESVWGVVKYVLRAI